MLYEFLSLKLSGVSDEEIYKLILSRPTPSLKNLFNPGHPDFLQGQLFSNEKKLTAVIREFSLHGEEIESKQDFDMIGTLWAYLDAKLFASVDRRLTLAEQYIHWFGASDGLIYGCQGACETCQSELQSDVEISVTDLLIHQVN